MQWCKGKRNVLEFSHAIFLHGRLTWLVKQARRHRKLEAKTKLTRYCCSLSWDFRWYTRPLAERDQNGTVCTLSGISSGIQGLFPEILSAIQGLLQRQAVNGTVALFPQSSAGMQALSWDFKWYAGPLAETNQNGIVALRPQSSDGMHDFVLQRQARMVLLPSFWDSKWYSGPLSWDFKWYSGPEAETGSLLQA